MKPFFEKHPLLRILAIDSVLTVVALGLALFLCSMNHWAPSTVLFIESLGFLLLAVSAVTGNSNLRGCDVYYAKDCGHQSYLDSYAFAITVGLPGIILFVLSGFMPAI